MGVMRKAVVQPFVDKLPERMSDEQILSLYRSVRNSNPENVYEAELLRGLLRFGSSIVAEFAIKAPSQVPELFSEMADELWCAIEAMRQGAIDHHDPPNVMGYVAVRLRGRLKKFVYREIRHRIRYRDQGKKKHREKIPKSSRDSLYELEEILNACLKTERERQVIGLRLQGLDDVQIGKELGCSKQSVHEIRSRIKNRFTEQLNGIPRINT
jgi:FixJ family two-component response regulator